MKLLLRWWYWPPLLIFLAFYLAQHANMAPNAADGALILDYIRLIAEGKYPFWDFIDLYGPLNWIMPTISYILAGHQVWGIQIWLVILKIIICLLVFILLRRSADFKHAMLALFLTALLLGLPWQYLQTPYSFLHSLPLLFLAWTLLLPCYSARDSGGDSATRTGHLILAGIAVSWIIWTKLNTGMLALAGGVWYLLHWAPQVQFKRNCFRWLKINGLWQGLIALALVLQILVFLFYLRNHFNKSFGLYLAMPLLICGVLSAQQLWSISKKTNPLALWQSRALQTLIFITSSGVSSTLFYFVYYGWDGGQKFIHETLQILAALNYASPFPLLGNEGFYQAFNSMYWLQLPWLTSLVVCLALFSYALTGRGYRDSQLFQREKNQLVGLWGMAVFLSFAMYSRADETHIFQAIVPNVPPLCLALHVLFKNLYFQENRLRRFGFSLTAIFFILWGSTIVTWPSLTRLQWQEGSWNSAQLRFLNFGEKRYRILADMSEGINQASQYIDEKTPNGSEVLVLTQDQLINYNSHTEPVGGRYRYLFYLLRSNLILRDAFDKIVPAEILQSILTHPPKMIVTDFGTPNLLKQIPEFGLLMRTEYHHTRNFGKINVYERVNSN